MVNDDVISSQYCNFSHPCFSAPNTFYVKNNTKHGGDRLALRYTSKGIKVLKVIIIFWCCVFCKISLKLVNAAGCRFCLGSKQTNHIDYYVLTLHCSFLKPARRRRNFKLQILISWRSLPSEVVSFNINMCLQVFDKT